MEANTLNAYPPSNSAEAEPMTSISRATRAHDAAEASMNVAQFTLLKQLCDETGEPMPTEPLTEAEAWMRIDELRMKEGKGDSNGEAVLKSSPPPA